MAAVIRSGVLAHSPPSTRRLVVAVPALVLALATACSSDAGGNASPTTTSRDEPRATSSTTVASARSVEAEIVARYRAFWEARFAASEDPVDPDHPGLSEYATGAQLENVIAETRQRRDEGLAFRRPERSVSERRPKVLSVDGAEAEVQDCATNDGIVYRIATGEVLDDSVVTRNVMATMRLVDGDWKLAEARVVQEWEGVAGCAASAEL